MKRGMRYSDFLEALDKEQNYLQNGGTSYRRQTAAMARDLASINDGLAQFLNRQELVRQVRTAYPLADEERIQDVAKMLNVVAKNVYLRSNVSDEAAAYVRSRKARRKPLTLMKHE
ncbi:hypothetical protein C772_01516 [Bhargavaea cecembensis DSE10]|uniref:Uncharacterized protein n=1 Tax=Bhargavaea cecembensis DSE10 TaxID=1235279 RepID=M7NHF7_9BACL|nr:hypothetical protein [Bhargavaea cecembensis]EMR06621.1 hypothetical protein C772_01516 [Bhargavaea cecembensis DSE10]